MPPPNVARDNAGFEDFDAYFNDTDTIQSPSALQLQSPSIRSTDMEMTVEPLDSSALEKIETLTSTKFPEDTPEPEQILDEHRFDIAARPDNDAGIGMSPDRILDPVLTDVVTEIPSAVPSDRDGSEMISERDEFPETEDYGVMESQDVESRLESSIVSEASEEPRRAPAMRVQYSRRKKRKLMEANLLPDELEPPQYHEEFFEHLVTEFSDDEIDDDKSVDDIYVSDDEPHPPSDYEFDSYSEDEILTSDEDIEEEIDGVRVAITEIEERPAIRRSTRVKVPPVEFWRNEHVNYVWDSETKTQTIQSVHLIEPAPQAPARRKRQRQRPIITLDSNGMSNSTVQDVQARIFNDTLNQWQQRVVAQSIDTKDEGSDLTSTVKSNTLLQTEESRIKIARLTIELGGGLFDRNSADFAYIFVSWDGRIEARVHQKTIVVRRGVILHVPPGNDFEIKNVGTTEAHILMFQVQKSTLNGHESPNVLLNSVLSLSANASRVTNNSDGFDSPQSDRSY